MGVSCILSIILFNSLFCYVACIRGQQCTFGYTSVNFCDWTPWSSWNCTGCCNGDLTVTRHRGLCCGKMLDDAACLFSCGLNSTDGVKANTESCSSTCDCSHGGLTSMPTRTRIQTTGDQICYKDESLVMQCSGKCKEKHDDWGQCIHDCGNEYVNKICLIKNISLFILGLIVGIIASTIVYCILYRKQESLQKGAKDLGTGALNQVTPIRPSKPSMNLGF